MQGSLSMRHTRFSIGLEQGPDGFTRAHALDLFGCVAEGSAPEPALAAFQAVLSEWLQLLQRAGEEVPARDVELELTIDEWIATPANVAGGASDVCFDADLRPLTDPEIAAALHRLGDLRAQLLAAVRKETDASLTERSAGDYSAGQILDELARAQWWTLSRLGASPLAEVPDRLRGRLDTAMALVVERFTSLSPERRAVMLELEGELWTPRKVLRRLLSLEWSLGRAARHALSANRTRP
jgi:predicted RNase H-like HicB family nuclease